MALPVAELRGMSTERLVEWHDEACGGIGETSSSFRDELARRDQEKATQAMKRLTGWITAMTAIMTIATIVNVILFALSV